MEFRKLKAEEIDVKVGNVTAKGYTLLLYKNARCDMNILDETLGVENWQRDHKEVKGNLYCGVGVNVNYNNDKEPQWIWKWDCGVESQFGDKEKGEASDSFKRACVNLGIGRELYTSPFIFIACETLQQTTGYKLPDAERFRKFEVKEITYNDKGEIDTLIVQDTKGVVVFNNKDKQPKETPKTTPKDIVGGDYLFDSGKYKGFTIAQVLQQDRQYIDYLLASDKVSTYIKENILEAIKHV